MGGLNKILGSDSAPICFISGLTTHLASLDKPLYFSMFSLLPSLIISIPVDYMVDMVDMVDSVLVGSARFVVIGV